MSAPVIVLILTGKGKDRANTAEVRLFATKGAAEAECKRVTTEPQKYWTYAQILDDGEEIETYWPYDE